MLNLTKAIPTPDPGLRMIPCTVAQVSPLVVTLATGGAVTGMRVLGTTYSVGAQAVAMWTPPNTPIILLIGA